MSDFNVEVGLKMFNARKNLKMSRADLGKKVNLHETTIKRYEDGNIKSLDIEKLKEFANALDISPAYLMGWESKEPNEIQQTENLISVKERKLLNSFNKLNDLGKGEAIKRVNELTYINKYTEIKSEQKEDLSYLAPIAAHDDNLSDEEKTRMDEIIVRKLKELGKL